MAHPLAPFCIPECHAYWLFVVPSVVKYDFLGAGSIEFAVSVLYFMKHFSATTGLL